MIVRLPTKSGRRGYTEQSILAEVFAMSDNLPKKTEQVEKATGSG